MDYRDEQLEGRIAALERIIDGVLERMGVPAPLLRKWHLASTASRYAAIGSANSIVNWLTARESIFEDLAMCGRYAIVEAPSDLRHRFGTLNQTPNFDARYNCAPTQDLPVIRFNAEDGTRSLNLLRWGLIPSWAADTAAGARAINARCETLNDKPTFRKAYSARRCIVPATAYYEWQHRGATKVPHAIALASGETMAFAGLWEGWWPPHADRTNPSQMLRTFTIITCPAAEEIMHLHERMPVILPPEAWPLWLGEEPGAPDSVLTTYPGQLLKVWEVGPAVGNVHNEGKHLLDPVVTLL